MKKNKSNSEMRCFLIEYLDPNVGWYKCVLRGNSLAEVIERLRAERTIFKLKGEITKKPA